MTKPIWLRLSALALLWGSEFLFIEIALRGFEPVAIVAVRLLLAAFLLIAIARSWGERLPRDGSLYFHCAVLGLIGTVVPYFLMAWAQTRISSALTGILVGSGPLMTAAIAAIMLRSERLTPLRLLGLLIGLIGVVVVIDPWHSDVSGDLLGSIAALGVALGFAVAYVYNVRFLTRHSASGPMIMSIQSAFGALYAIVWTLTVGGFTYTSNNGALLSVIILGIFNTGVAAVVFFSLLRRAGAVTTSIVEYLMVVVAVVLGVVFLDEHISTITAFGVLLIIGGVAITERKKYPSTQKTTDPAAST